LTTNGGTVLLEQLSAGLWAAVGRRGVSRVAHEAIGKLFGFSAGACAAGMCARRHLARSGRMDYSFTRGISGSGG
jgi:hypothetical protein